MQPVRPDGEDQLLNPTILPGPRGPGNNQPEAMEISICSIDVGFDPRANDIEVMIPPGAVRVKYDLPRAGGVCGPAPYPAGGTPEEIAATLEAAGYRIAWGPKFDHRDLDGTWNRFTSAGILECRDPNDGCGFDPDGKSRFQWVWGAGELWARRLPPGADRWRNSSGLPADMPAEPWQRASMREHWSLLREYVEWAREDGWQRTRPAPCPRVIVGDSIDPRVVVVELTENGREIRWYQEPGGYVVQPQNDNYWIECSTLQEARQAFAG